MAPTAACSWTARAWRWLRLELSPDGRLHASVKAHKDDRAEINATADVPAKGLNAARASDLLGAVPQAGGEPCRAPAAGPRQRGGGERAGLARASTAWSPPRSKATNGALAQAGARLVPLAPAAWEAELRRYRMTLSVEVNGDDVARMHIERLPHEMEVAVGVREPQLIDLGRRRRIPVEGMTIHALAELIASCAWPAIERFRETAPRGLTTHACAPSFPLRSSPSRPPRSAGRWSGSIRGR